MRASVTGVWVRTAALAAALALSSPHVYAAGGAFAVDDPDIGAPWSCKVESWTSFSDKQFIGISAPACVVDVGRPIEVTTQFQRMRTDGDWDTGLTLRGKINILPTAPGKIGVGFVGGTNYDLLTGDNTQVFAYVPISYQFVEQFRVLVNGGWMWDRIADQHFFTYGGGFEWNFVKPFTLIGEVFGQIGAPTDPSTASDPRLQIGLRYTPFDSADIDLIYGRNITGENANWITLGLNVRFEASK